MRIAAYAGAFMRGCASPGEVWGARKAESGIEEADPCRGRPRLMSRCGFDLAAALLESDGLLLEAGALRVDRRSEGVERGLRQISPIGALGRSSREDLVGRSDLDGLVPELWVEHADPVRRRPDRAGTRYAGS